MSAGRPFERSLSTELRTAANRSMRTAVPRMPRSPDSPLKAVGFDPQQWQLPWEVLERSTDGFAPRNVVGEGIMSTCYRARLHGKFRAVRLLTNAQAAMDEARLLSLCDRHAISGVATFVGWGRSATGQYALVTELLEKILDLSGEGLDLNLRVIILCEAACIIEAVRSFDSGPCELRLENIGLTADGTPKLISPRTSEPPLAPECRGAVFTPASLVFSVGRALEYSCMFMVMQACFFSIVLSWAGMHKWAAHQHAPFAGPLITGAPLRLATRGN